MTVFKNSKNLLIVVLMLFFSLALAAEAGTGYWQTSPKNESPVKRPVIQFEAKEIDFGMLESGQVSDMKFEFQNIGNTTLIIKNVSTSCGCTATKLAKREYIPMEKGHIEVKFLSQGYSGRVVKSVTVTTNDLKNKHTILKIKGEVKLTKFALLELTPDKIHIKGVEIGKSYTEIVTLKNSGTIPLRIVELMHAPEISPQFTKKMIGAGEELELKVVFTPMQAGRFTSFFKIRSNAHRRPVSLIKVTAVIPGEVKKDPKSKRGK